MERRGSSTIHGEIISFEPPGSEGSKSRDEELELRFLKEKGDVVTDSGPKFGKRHLEVISFFLLGFINQCMRQHLSITIVAMTDPNANKNKNIPTFDWTNKNVILSSFFWGYIGPQILSGWLASRYGPKWFLVGSTAVTALLGLLTPWLAVHLGSTSVIASRALQGVSQSFMVPSTSYFFSRWVPTSERARSSAFVLSACSFATIVSMLVSGPIAASQYGWPMIFYIFSTLGFAWCIYYAIFGCDSPIQHKTITEAEKIFIIKTAVDSSKKQPKTPWRNIVTSVPFWALMYSYTCSILITWTFLSEIPSYMNKIMKFNINSNGLLTSLIYVVQWVNSLILSTTSDYLTNNNYLSTTVARKLFAAFGMVGSGTVLLFLAQCTEDDSTKGVILLMIAVGALGANNCSLGINNLDLAPDHAGVLQGFINGFSHIFAVLAPLIVQFMVHDESNPEQWKKVFYLVGGTTISAAVVFALFGTAKRQSWNDVEDGGPKFGKRHLEIINFFFLWLISQCMRQHLSITIVAMTDPTTNEDKSIPTFEWNNKNVILSSFFWGYIAPQVLAGWLVTRYGPKWFLIGSTSLTALVGFLTPWLAIHFGSTSMIVARVLQGVLQACVVPSMSYFFSRWIPVCERARSTSFVLSGISVSTIFTMSISGPIAVSKYGWPMIFYLFSFLGIVWSVYYAIFGYDTPVEHKSITEAEKLFIIKTAVDTTKKQQKTPWGRIVLSAPFWALMYTYTSCILINWLFLTEIPNYMNQIMKFNIKSNGLLTSLIYLVQWGNSILMSTICDYIINKNYVSINVARKIFTSIGTIGPGIAILFLAQCTEENSTEGVVLLMIAVGALGANTCSTYINNLDIAPDHASVLQGFINGFSHIFAVLAPLSVQFLVDDETDPEQWKKVFYLASGAVLSGLVVFLLFGSANKQPWNDIEEDEENEDTSK